VDITQEYIKMCEKAVEIQGEWEPKVGDYVKRRYTLLGEEIDNRIWSEEDRNEIIVLHFKSTVGGYFHACNEKGEERTFNNQQETHKAMCLFLPRQDQLQEMWKGSFELCRNGLGEYQFDTLEDDFFSTGMQKSTEIALLMGIMYQKFNKTWNGEDWISNV